MHATIGGSEEKGREMVSVVGFYSASSNSLSVTHRFKLPRSLNIHTLCKLTLRGCKRTLTGFRGTAPLLLD